MVDIVIAGAGPAGRALSAACSDSGLSVLLVDPAPHRPWRATYGLWSDELPGLPARLVAARAQTTLVITDAGRRRLTDRGYCVLDNVALRAESHRDGVIEHTGRVRSIERTGGGCTVRLTDGRAVTAGLFVDATGSGPVGAQARPTGSASAAGRPREGRGSAAQTALGVVLPALAARRYVAPGEAVFMDWRAVELSDGAPSFCYSVPLGADEVLIEETCLAGRPALSIAELRRRLTLRMAQHGVDLTGARRQERVRITLDGPTRAADSVVRFGAAAGLVHPATGYGMATALGLAPAVARALAATDRSDPDAAARAVNRVLWSPKARVVHALRRYGLEVLLTLDRVESSKFFTSFFRIPGDGRTAYLSDREDVVGTARAMAAVLARSGPSLILRMTTGGRFTATRRCERGNDSHRV